MPGGSFRSSVLIAALLAAAGAAGYDVYLRTAAPGTPPPVVHDPPTAAQIAAATEPMRRELEAAKLTLAAIAADRDNLKQQLDALNKPAPVPAPVGDKPKAAGSMQKQLEAATRQRDAALSEAAALKRRTQQLEAQSRAAPAPSPLPAAAPAGGKVYTQRTVAELREIYAEAAPGAVPTENEAGKWIETTTMRVLGLGVSGVVMLKKDNNNVQCTFADSAKAKLISLRVGDAVKVTGKINQEQNGQLVNLDDCELRE